MKLSGCGMSGSIPEIKQDKLKYNVHKNITSRVSASKVAKRQMARSLRQCVSVIACQEADGHFNFFVQV